MKNWEPLTCAYFAGLFDGEGCFNIRIHRPSKKPDSSHYMCRICITNTNLPMIEWIMENFGGNFHKRTFDPKRTSRMEIPEDVKQIRSECIQTLHNLNHRGSSIPCPLSPSALR